MKTILQLLVAFLILNGCFQTGRFYWTFYEFTDAVDREVLLGKETTESQMHAKVIQLAGERDIYLEPEQVKVDRRGEETTIWASYVADIPLVPGFYVYPKTFEHNARARRVRHLVDDMH